MQKSPVNLALEIYFPNVIEETSRQYQPGSNAYVETTKSYTYDTYGNVTNLYDNEIAAIQDRRVHAVISYDFNIPGADYQKQSPSSISVMDSNGTLVRQRNGTYGRYGELLTLDQFESASMSHRYSLSYDQYGNLSSISDPRGHTLAWTYDEDVHSYPATITSSTAAWEVLSTIRA